MSDTITILGIETSCDETAAAVLRRHGDGTTEILSNIIHTQDDHAAFGGVVPEIAARAHVEKADQVVARALAEAGMTDDGIGGGIDAVAATAGPGLIGGVMVGMMTAKAFALSRAIPFIPVNHLEGHALSARLTENCPFPYLLLLVSGGHTQLLRVDGVGQYARLGTTIDDAAGEAFDKTAKLLGLGQPGGPKVQAAAEGGDAARFTFPRPLLNRPGYDFSFSGLKTAVRLAAEELSPLGGSDIADICASFQHAAARHLAARTERAMADFDIPAGDSGRLVIAGGVAANTQIRAALTALVEAQGWSLLVPPAKYCTDNAAMIALAGAERLAAGSVPALAETLALAPRARWPLDENPEGRRHGGGKKGPKA
ncbi:tRNA (adenosine(37)-N6)-threonylcarbamoyltransferase complex transferase subunit TsaD [Aquisalinus flavus]|nr:tRNA (adenosine(37)-N6)-threonylcarbamoyltransferase complex transferase subunit TsaD [Aquisalinus flavus]MBD0425513.1 tRNA (adenosine(37)-N6)-threonylcarbamoyltransferase complex transferase subunit TsaD [Aquisalinus flavus]UNE48856.1 tRNA (adenosine(37)-N6)-threonylcarbamoyltransferase complex transferase subunit TsaD [Aquisalinus flavus]